MQMAEFDDKTPTPLRAPREDRWLERHLDNISAQNAHQNKTLEIIRSEVTELRAVVATEADCAGRAERERLDRGDGLRRVFDDINGVKQHLAEELGTVKQRIDLNSRKLEALAGERREETGAHKVIKTIEDEKKDRRRERRELVFKVLAGVVTAAAIGVGGWVLHALVN